MSAGRRRRTVVGEPTLELALARTRYEIVLSGPLGPRLANAIEGFEVVSCGSERTHLVGWVADQAALQGALRRVSDLGLRLVSVREITGP